MKQMDCGYAVLETLLTEGDLVYARIPVVYGAVHHSVCLFQEAYHVSDALIPSVVIKALLYKCTVKNTYVNHGDSIFSGRPVCELYNLLCLANSLPSSSSTVNKFTNNKTNWKTLTGTAFIQYCWSCVLCTQPIFSLCICM